MSTPKRRRRFDREFKVESVRLVEQRGGSVSFVARAFGKMKIHKPEDHQMQKPLLLFLIICLLISCAGNRPKTVSQAGEVRTMEVPYKNLFKATRDYLQERGFPVVKTNMTTGEIETDYKPGAGWTDNEYEYTAEKTKIENKWSNYFRFRDRGSETNEKRARVRAKIQTSLSNMFYCEVSYCLQAN